MKKFSPSKKKIGRICMPKCKTKSLRKKKANKRTSNDEILKLIDLYSKNNEGDE